MLGQLEVVKGLPGRLAGVFHPVGAEAVRMRFEGGDRIQVLVIEDGPRAVRAVRRE